MGPAGRGEGRCQSAAKPPCAGRRDLGGGGLFAPVLLAALKAEGLSSACHSVTRPSLSLVLQLSIPTPIISVGMSEGKVDQAFPGGC